MPFCLVHKHDCCGVGGVTSASSHLNQWQPTAFDVQGCHVINLRTFVDYLTFLGFSDSADLPIASGRGRRPS